MLIGCVLIDLKCFLAHTNILIDKRKPFGFGLTLNLFKSCSILLNCWGFVIQLSAFKLLYCIVKGECNLFTFNSVQIEEC